MTKLADFNINELMLFIVGVLGAIGGFMVILQKSKCEEVNCCCMKCKRDVKAIIEEEKLQMTGHTGTTPRRSARLSELELKRKSEETEEEPEVEKVS